MNKETFLRLKTEGLVNWSSLLHGWTNHWIDCRDIADYAQKQLAEKSDSPDWLVDLANAEHQSKTSLESLLSKAILAEPPPTSGVDAWKLAALLVIRDEPVKDQDKIDMLEELFAEFGYPDDLRRISKYGPSTYSVEKGLASSDDALIDPLAEMSRIIGSLSSK